VHFVRVRLAVREVFAVDGSDGAVDDGFLHGFKLALAAADQLSQRQHKIAFQRERASVLAVIGVDVHRVQKVRAARIVLSRTFWFLQKCLS
jgi:hypothetical protein